jgi:hypothetical protein
MAEVVVCAYPSCSGNMTHANVPVTGRDWVERH